MQKEFTLKDFEELREEYIQKGKALKRSVHALGLFEGLLEITKPNDAEPPEEYVTDDPPDFHKKMKTLRYFNRIYKNKKLRIVFQESIRLYTPSYYSAEGHMLFLGPLEDSLPFAGASCLSFSFLETKTETKDVDDIIFLLQTYKEAMNSASYQKRMDQKQTFDPLSFL